MPRDPGAAPTVDPLTRAVVREDTGSAIIVDVRAFSSSRLGDLFADCMGKDEGLGLFGAFAELGIDLSKDVDRVAIVDGGVLLVGRFGATRALVTSEGARDHGARGKLVATNALGRSSVVAVWGDGVIFVADDEADAKRSIDRLEGKAGTGTPLLSADEAYGDMFGVVGEKRLASLLGTEGLLAEGALAAAGDVRVHADFQDQAYVSFELDAAPPPVLALIEEGVAKMIAARRAKLEGRPLRPENAFLPAFLDGISTRRTEHGIAVDVVAPIEYFERQLAGCRFGKPHPPPDGWVVGDRPLPAGFLGAPMPGLLSMEDNRLALAQTYPSMEITDDVWFDPVSGQVLSYRHVEKTGLCARRQGLHDLLAKNGSRIRPVSLDGVTWTRVVSTDNGNTTSIEYTHCADDELWTVYTSRPSHLLEDVALERIERHLRGLTLKPMP
ncbi:hypothetical protein L6R52_07115 [Myxococcota bacterium]|nr:hypothetical protein [Myxococcota bacterium]